MLDKGDAPLRKPINLANMTGPQQKRFEQLIEERARSAEAAGEGLTQDEIQELARQAVLENEEKD